jgi:hypothetical protein
MDPTQFGLKEWLYMQERDRFKMTKEKKDEMTAAIKNYFLQEKDEEFGNLASSLLLDFIIERLAPEFLLPRGRGLISTHDESD